jgi:hypothetical protein
MSKKRHKKQNTLYTVHQKVIINMNLTRILTKINPLSAREIVAPDTTLIAGIEHAMSWKVDKTYQTVREAIDMKFCKERRIKTRKAR